LFPPQKGGHSTLPKGNSQDALAELAAFGLIQLRPGFLRVHRVVHETLCEEFGSKSSAHWLRHARNRLIAHSTGDLPAWRQESWPRWAPLIPHILATLDAAHAMGDDSPKITGLCHEAGIYLSQRGDFPRAERLLRRALAACEKHTRDANQSTLSALVSLGNLFQRQGDYAQAEPFYRRALADSEQLRGPASRNTVIAASNLALLLRARGNTAEAEALCHQALETSGNLLGPKPPDPINNINKLAEFLDSKSDPAPGDGPL
jgi:tetratricopeptide (TPR) repeat protein